MVESGFELKQFNFGDHVLKDDTTHWRGRGELQHREGTNIERVFKRSSICLIQVSFALRTTELWLYCISLRLLFISYFDLHILFRHMTTNDLPLLYLQDSWFRMALWGLVKINIVVWEGTASSAERQGKQNVPVWTFASGTTNLCVALMENFMKTTVKCIELLAWKSKRLPLFTMKTASLKVNTGWN